MKPRFKPKVFLRRDAEIKLTPYGSPRTVGYIQLVKYYCGKSTPQIEYKIDEKFRNQGIMSKELPKYLKLCKKWNNTKLLANVKKDNIASIKILEKNDFILLAKFKDIHCYVIDLNLTKTQLLKGMEAMEKNGYKKERV